MRTWRSHDRAAKTSKPPESWWCTAHCQTEGSDVVHEWEGALPCSRDKTIPFEKPIRGGIIESPTCSPNANHEHDDTLPPDTQSTPGPPTLLSVLNRTGQPCHRTFFCFHCTSMTSVVALLNYGRRPAVACVLIARDRCLGCLGPKRQGQNRSMTCGPESSISDEPCITMRSFPRHLARSDAG
jgi:hypothetical protein